MGILIRQIALLFFILYVIRPAFCQTDKMLVDQLLQVSIQENSTENIEPSVFKSINLAKRPYLFLPAGLMWAYRNVLSEQITAECAYELSCSRFATSSISRYGFIKGIWLTTDRLSRCNQMSPEESYLIWLDKNTGRIIDVPEMYR